MVLESTIVMVRENYVFDLWMQIQTDTKGWKLQTISRARREVWIKSLAQTFSSYVVFCCALPYDCKVLLEW